MHIKFLAHGTGSGGGAARYLLAELDHKGDKREEIRVLHGDPTMVGAVADTLNFKQKYTSGVIAWSAEEAPTDAEIEEVMRDFRRVAFAGLDPSRIAHSEIMHREADGAVHIHTLTANVDLDTGKAFNPAPPGWEKSFDPVRDMHNHMRGWARPDDPTRARTTSPNTWKEAVNLRDQVHDKNIKKIIDDYLFQRIESSLIHNRDDIKTALIDAGFLINRESDNYISIKDPETNTKIRLKGAFYEFDFRPENALAIENPERSSRGGEVDTERATAAREQLERAIERRVRFNSNRYAEPSKDAKRQHEQHDQAHVYRVRSSISSQLDLSRLGISASLQKTRDLLSADDISGGTKRRSDTENERRQNLQATDRQAGFDVQLQQPESHVLRSESKGEKINDRDRNIVIEFLENLGKRINSAREIVIGQIREIDKVSLSIRTSSENIILGSENIKRGVNKVRENNNQELEDFKRNINLAEYASSLGYELVKKESSRNCKVMKSGNDKIVITKASDGHDLYFSVHGGHRGSIIDLVQNIKGLNLGQVRQELRPWSGSQYVTQRVPEIRIARPAQHIPRDLEEIAHKAAELEFYSGNYLGKRGIKDSTLDAFSEIIREDERGNACFLHSNAFGDITGWEVKNTGFTGFSGGGVKSLFTQTIGYPRTAIIVESAIDAMSHYQTHGEPQDVTYISIAGGMSMEQQKQLKTELVSFEHVIVATDNDAAGEQYCDTIAEMRPDAVRERPDLKDWNDDLQAQQVRARSSDYGMER